jgi:hypothetical protein
MKVLLLLGRLPNDGGVRRHLPNDIGQVFKLLVIGRVSNDEGMPPDLGEEIGGRPRGGGGGGGGGLHAQRRGAGVEIGTSREGGSRAPGAGRVEGGGEEKEGGPGAGAWAGSHAAALLLLTADRPYLVGDGWVGRLVDAVPSKRHGTWQPRAPEGDRVAKDTQPQQRRRRKQRTIEGKQCRINARR